MRRQQPLEVILARQLADLLGIALLVLDFDGNVVDYNEVAQTVFGWDVEPAHRSLDRWLADDDAIDRFRGALRCRRPAHAHLRVGADGIPRSLVAAAFPVLPGWEIAAVAFIWEEHPSSSSP